MKVFTPINDTMLANLPTHGSRRGAPGDSGEFGPRLVPFHPDFLRGQRVPVREGVKPANWITESDYASARRRLRESAAV